MFKLCDTNLLALRGTLCLQCICRAQIIIAYIILKIDTSWNPYKIDWNIWNGSKSFKIFSSKPIFIGRLKSKTNKWFSSYEEQYRGKGNFLNSKGQPKYFFWTQKVCQTTYIFCDLLWLIFIQPFHTNLLARRRILGLQCICRAQLIIQMAHIHYCLPCNYVPSLLAYCRV